MLAMCAGEIGLASFWVVKSLREESLPVSLSRACELRGNLVPFATRSSST